MGKELTQLEHFQRELSCRGWKMIDGKIHPEEKIYINHKHGNRKISYEKIITEELSPINSGNRTTYSVSSLYDFLNNLVLFTRTPRVEVKPEKVDRIRIAWTHNLGAAIIKEAILKDEKGRVVDQLDQHSFCIKSQIGYSKSVRDKNFYLTSIGSIPLLEEWNTYLPEYPLHPNQPFFFSNDETTALPILKNIQYTLVYQFTLELTELLRMQEHDTETGEWKDIPVNLQYLLPNERSVYDNIEVPKLIGDYSVTNDHIKEYWLNSRHVQYYDSFVKINDPKKFNYGESGNITLKHTLPAKALFWVNENLTSSRKNNYTNYTSDSDCVYLGVNPNIEYSLGVGVGGMLPIEKAEKDNPVTYFYATSEPGYNAIPFCLDPFSFDLQPSEDLNDIKLNLLFRRDDSQESSSQHSDEISTTGSISLNRRDRSDDFATHCYLLVYRKLEFYQKDDKIILAIDEIDTKKEFFEDKLKQP